MKRVAQRLRDAAVQYIIKNYRRPLDGVPGNATGRDLVYMEYVVDPELRGKVKGPKTYVEYMTNYTTYAGVTELHALSGLLRCGIVVHPHGSTQRNACEEGQYFNVQRGPSEVERKTNEFDDVILHLAFDEDSQHYSAIVSRHS